MLRAVRKIARNTRSFVRDPLKPIRRTVNHTGQRFVAGVIEELDKNDIDNPIVKRTKEALNTLIESTSIRIWIFAFRAIRA